MKKKITAIILAAGKGSRMNSDIEKQFMLLEDKPLLYYSLNTFQNSLVDSIILVVSENHISYCQEQIVDKYSFTKVDRIVAGGKERYNSVHKGLIASEDADYVVIHDGARPFVTKDMIAKSVAVLESYDGCTVGMPVKDTIKVVNEHTEGIDTPNRESLWQIQTPQTFKRDKLLEAYDKMFTDNHGNITDDTMIIERYNASKIKVLKGDYTNIKITTPEDLKIAEIFLKKLLTLED